ncbi:hypothetical protein [Streptomyces sp. 4F14]
MASDAPRGALRAMGIVVPTGRGTQGNRSAAHHLFGLLSVDGGAA